LTAIAGLFLFGFQQAQAELNGFQNSLVVILILLLYLGSGALAVWKPEEFLIHHKVGGRRETTEQVTGEVKELYVQAAE